MHPHLQDYVERIAALADTDLPPHDRVVRARRALGDLLAKEWELEPGQRVLPAEGYARHLLHRDPDHGFVVLALVWPPGYEGTPHDHGTWGAFGVREGELSITSYAPDPDSPELLHEGRTTTLRAGTTAHVLPPQEDFHRVSNPRAEVTLSLHTYGAEIRRCRLFDLDRHTFEVVEADYTSVPSVSTSAW